VGGGGGGVGLLGFVKGGSRDLQSLEQSPTEENARHSASDVKRAANIAQRTEIRGSYRSKKKHA